MTNPAHTPVALDEGDLLARLEKASAILANDDVTPPMTENRARRVFVTEAIIESRAELATLRTEVARLTEENETYRTAFDGIDPARLKEQPGVVKAEATELLRNAEYSDGLATVLTQDCEALEAALTAPVSQEPVDAELREAAKSMGAELVKGSLLVGSSPQPTEEEPSEAGVERAARAEAERDRLAAALASEERRSAELLKRLDKTRAGKEPDFCYDPDEWEFTCSWDDRNQVHGYGDGLPLGKVMQIATLIRGPRKWVAHVPVTWDENGDPDDAEIQWFDSEDDARAALDTAKGAQK